MRGHSSGLVSFGRLGRGTIAALPSKIGISLPSIRIACRTHEAIRAAVCTAAGRQKHSSESSSGLGFRYVPELLRGWDP
jgi:hypothetical protein